MLLLECESGARKACGAAAGGGIGFDAGPLRRRFTGA